MPRGKAPVGVADGRALRRCLRAPSKRHSPSTPPSRSPVSGSGLPIGIVAHLCARLISAHRCELRRCVLALLSPQRMVHGPTATGFYKPRPATVWSSSHAWSHLTGMSQPLTETESITERVLARTLGAKLSTILTEDKTEYMDTSKGKRNK
jgi:hypothetical protein